LPEDAARGADSDTGNATGSSGDPSTVPSGRNAADRGAQLRVGDPFLEYELVEWIGNGAFGHVWRAYSPFEDRYVALKILPAELSDDEVEMERVRACFKRIHHLHHQHICPVYRLARHPLYGYCLVMRFVRGRSPRPLSGAEAIPGTLEILEKAASALDYAHARNVVHRDIKPGNILVSDDEDLQIVDFGLAEQIHSSMSRISARAGEIVGTPAYMSPEACRGAQQNGRSDQYSLACVAYYLLSGRPPFEGEPWVVLDCHRHQVPGAIAGLPGAMNGALLRALEKTPDQRYSSCKEFAKTLLAAHGAPRAQHRVDAVPSRDATIKALDWSAFSSPIRGVGGQTLLFAPSNERLLVVYKTGQCVIFDLKVGEWTTVKHAISGQIVAATCTPAGGFFVLASSREIAAVDARHGNILTRTDGPAGDIVGLAAVEGGVVWVGTRQSIAYRINLATGKLVARRRLRETDAHGFDVSTPEQWLLVHGPQQVRFSPLGSGAWRRGWTCEVDPAHRVERCAFARGSVVAAVMASNGTISLQRPKQRLGSLLSHPPDTRVCDFAFSRGGEKLLTLASDARVRVFDTITGGHDRTMSAPDQGSRIEVSAEGTAVVMKRDGSIAATRLGAAWNLGFPAGGA